MRKSIAVVILAIIASGCASYTDRYRADLRTRVIPAVFRPNVEMISHAPATGSASHFSILWFISFDTPSDYAIYTGQSPVMTDRGIGIDIDFLDEAALENACVRSNADILVGPTFTRTETGGAWCLWLFCSKTVECKGYPARITGYEKIPSSEIKSVRWVDGCEISL